MKWIMTKYKQLQEHLKDNQNTWLITGVAGFIGSNLLEKLLILNQKVVGLDNFDTGHQYNIDQAIEDANRATGKDLSNNLKYRDFRAGDVRHSQADITKAKALLNYKPVKDVKKGLDEAMDWYVKSLS